MEHAPDMSPPESDSSSGTDSGPSSYSLSLLVEDYIFRGDELEDYSIYELTCLTCSKGSTDSERDRYVKASESLSEGETLSWNRRVLFRPGHSKVQSRWTSFLKSPKVPTIICRYKS